MNEETRKYLRLLIRLRRAAAELDGLSGFELAMLASELDVDEEDLRCLAQSDTAANNMYGGGGTNKT